MNSKDALADGGYNGVGIGVHTPVKQPPTARYSM